MLLLHVRPGDGVSRVGTIADAQKHSYGITSTFMCTCRWCDIYVSMSFSIDIVIRITDRLTWFAYALRDD